MWVVKNINNNVSLCKDSAGREVIVFGKGVGFVKPPQNLPLAKIERTFYNISDVDLGIIKNIPVSVMKSSIQIVDEAEMQLNITLMSTTTLALADHINFAIKRKNDPIALNITLQEDVNQIYQKEMQQAYRSLEIIEANTGILLDRKEAGMIALYFINNQVEERETRQKNDETLIYECVAIVEKAFNIVISTDSFDYSRFVTHVQYLFRRTLRNRQIESENRSLFEKTKQEYPIAYQCSLEISNLFQDSLGIKLNDEEKLYLMIHVNRLCAKAIKRNNGS